MTATPTGPRPVTPAGILAAKLDRLAARLVDEPELREAAEPERRQQRVLVLARRRGGIRPGRRRSLLQTGI